MNVRAVETQSASEEYAALNRKAFGQAGVLAVNLKGTPGSGKTSLLEGTIKLLTGKYRLGAIEIDPFTVRDSLRLRFAGIPVCQLNTEDTPHVEAELVYNALPELPLDDTDILFIENSQHVGGWAHDLGADCRVTVLGVTEGADKYAWLPETFRDSDAVLINKVDLMHRTDVNLGRLYATLARVCPFVPVFHVSARNQACLVHWGSWLTSQLARKRKRDQGAANNVVQLKRCETPPC